MLILHTAYSDSLPGTLNGPPILVKNKLGQGQVQAVNNVDVVPKHISKNKKKTNKFYLYNLII